MPPESSAGYFSSNSARPTERSRSRAFLRWVSLSSLLISTGSMTLLNTVRQSSSTSRWNTMPALPPAPFTGTPPTVIVPVVAGIRPDTSIISVLLPQPLGPTIETNSPAATSRSISPSASTASPLAVM